MNNALTHIQAAASACICTRNAFVRALVLGCAVAGASVPAFAGPDRDPDAPRTNQHQQAQPANRDQPRPERIAPQQQQPQQRAEMPRQEQRQYDPRAYDTRMVEEQRRQAQQQQQDQGARRGGRLTPDERRELRRQINEAGTDLYPNAPRR